MDKTKFFQKTIVVIMGALICSLLWGSAFPSIKIGYKLFAIGAEDFATQILFAGVRFVLAGLLAIFLGSLLQHRVLLPKKTSYGMIMKLSSFQTIGQYVCFYIGLAHTLGVRGSIIEGTNSFIAILVACLIYKQEKLTVRKVVGCILGFTGVILINVSGASTLAGSYLFGDLCVFVSVVCYAFSSIYLKRYSKEEDTVVLSSYQFVFGGLVMAIAGFLMGGRFSIITGKGIVMLLYLAFISAVAYSLWGILLTYNPISKVAIFGFMNPMFGFITSSIFLGEASSTGMQAILAMILICVGIYIVNAKTDETGKPDA